MHFSFILQIFFHFFSVKTDKFEINGCGNGTKYFSHHFQTRSYFFLITNRKFICVIHTTERIVQPFVFVLAVIKVHQIVYPCNELEHCFVCFGLIKIQLISFPASTLRKFLSSHKFAQSPKDFSFTISVHPEHFVLGAINLTQRVRCVACYP